ncbi:putative domain HDIG-containing protein [Halobacteroides halobius DSM 5150]|uniref:Putative domain HDIG-containing protein n=1 Tax=Halobacteroides halobius (strain ATCC 35273 / DSM 5150 / MD-1) TaxID=748449 RepID=L0KA28_HALHC|nr:HD-GYP domain-containing protein [Halobacteroides halobius]AGB40958.1 putative domain HDIG-containing protein [Halobacteroides halobius DSM 5150]
MKIKLNNKPQQQIQYSKETVEALAMTINKRDFYTAKHQRRVADLAVKLAKELKLSEFEIRGIELAALIHDLGKISIPMHILAKPTKLTVNEFNIIKNHPQTGYEITKDLNFPWPIAEMIYQHHERLDGSGYPKGLQKGEILLGARIIAVADIIEAMTSHRPYRPAKRIRVAQEEIKENQGVLYDSRVVQACLKIISKKGE